MVLVHFLFGNSAADNYYESMNTYFTTVICEMLDQYSLMHKFKDLGPATRTFCFLTFCVNRFGIREVRRIQRQ